MISPEKMDALQRGWVWLVQPFGIEQARAYPLFDDLVQRYSEAHRHHHTLEHVADLIKIVGKLGRGLPNGQLIPLAVWFHDAVFDPRRGDNERQSAELAQQQLSALGLPQDAIELITLWIRCTAHGDTRVQPASAECDVLLDADLAILGSSEARYLRYAADIRREYQWVPEAEYRVGRVSVLQSFLQRHVIYRTAVMRAEGEAQARSNMQRECDRLASQNEATP